MTAGGGGRKYWNILIFELTTKRNGLTSVMSHDTVKRLIGICCDCYTISNSVM